jgi:hypothetical protein
MYEDSVGRIVLVSGPAMGQHRVQNRSSHVETRELRKCNGERVVFSALFWSDTRAQPKNTRVLRFDV